MGLFFSEETHFLSDPPVQGSLQAGPCGSTLAHAYAKPGEAATICPLSLALSHSYRTKVLLKSFCFFSSLSVHHSFRSA